MINYKNQFKEKYYESHLDSLILGKYTICTLIGYADGNYYVNISNKINKLKYVIGPYETFTLANEKALFLISEIHRISDSLKDNILNIAAPHIKPELVNANSLKTKTVKTHTEKYESILFGEHTVKFAIRECPEDGLYDILITNSVNKNETKLQFYTRLPDTYLTWITRNYKIVNEYLRHILNAEMLAENTLEF